MNFILREDLRHDSRHGQMIRAQPTAGTEGQQENTQRFHKVSRCLYDEDKTSSSLLGVLERWSRRAGANVPAPTENEKTKGLSVGRYVDALICELEDKFDELALRDEEGKLIDTVAAFVAEPWVAVSRTTISYQTKTTDDSNASSTRPWDAQAQQRTTSPGSGTSASGAERSWSSTRRCAVWGERGRCTLGSSRRSGSRRTS